MKEEIPAYIQDDPNGLVFIEKDLDDMFQCIALDGNTSLPIRINIEKKRLSDIFQRSSKIDLYSLKLYYFVHGSDKSSKLFSGENYEVIYNSILQLNDIQKDGSKYIYGLSQGRKTLHFVPSDIKYIPMLNNNHNNEENFAIGSTVISVVDNCCHGLVKDREYIVKDMISDVYSILYGTLYLEDSVSGIFVTTYPINVKLKRTTNINVQSI